MKILNDMDTDYFYLVNKDFCKFLDEEIKTT